MYAQDITSDISGDVSTEKSASVTLANKSHSLSVEYNILGDINFAPLIVNADYLAVSFGGGVGFGVRLQERYNVGLLFDIDYLSIGASQSAGFNGAELSFLWMIIGGTILTEWVSLYYGLGVDLSFSSYGLSSSGFTKQTAVGPVLMLEPRFFIPKFRYVDFSLRCMVNLRISESFLPVVYGAARVNVHPYIQWLSLYAETGIKYFGYQNDVLRADMAQFVLSVGVSFDVYIKHKTKPKDSERITETSQILPKETPSQDKPSQEISSADKTDAADKPVETVEIVDTAQNVGIPENEPKQNDAGEDAAATQPSPTVHTTYVSDMDEATKSEYLELIEHLEAETGAKVLSFSDILFEPNSDQMLEGSEAVLDEVLQMLKENQLLRLNICGYTNNVGNKRMELKTSQKRVNRVVNYLVKHGIEASRFEVAAYGGENVKRAGINKINRRVEIRVLEDKE